MSITDLLLRDHQSFYQQFDALEAALQMPTQRELRDQLAKLGDSIGTHARLEDDLLFSTLEPFIGLGGPLAVMRSEHEEIERILGELQDESGPVKTRDLVPQLLEVALQHFRKEEMILFPMSEQVLDQAALEELGVQFEARSLVVRN